MLGFKQKKFLTKVRDYQSTFTSETGKRVFQDLMKTCHMSMPLCPGKLDPLEMAFAEGQRNIMLYIMRNLQMDALELEKHYNEQAKQEKLDQSEFF